ncbi:glucose PTS transporter transcription antiterminator GlcT [Virgibacillus xinjiangensis]|uniref:Glucose PTS transporter transcription antiterminator GlcT n=1 Tax=Virgibacillus xinjiangensis TaxID=393090 RepID=A0ABV7D016_9BACI
MNTYTIKKVLNNNVLIAEDEGQQEVILIGKGIGFHKKRRDTIREETVEKLFVLRSQKEQEQYMELVPQMEEGTLDAIIASIEMIRRRAETMLNEQVHVALTDHLMFAIHRLNRGLEIRNPFLKETKALYPAEYEIASEVVDYINQSLGISLPEGEVGFVALHVHSAIANKTISDINQYSQLVSELIDLTEKQLDITMDREGVEYVRLVRHLRYTIERVLQGEKLEEPTKIASLLKTEYPVCYNLSWKLIKVMQQALKKPVYDAEAVYLTMHLQRLSTKFE